MLNNNNRNKIKCQHNLILKDFLGEYPNIDGLYYKLKNYLLINKFLMSTYCESSTIICIQCGKIENGEKVTAK